MRIVAVKAVSPGGTIVAVPVARPGQLQDRLCIEFPHDKSARMIVCDRSLPDITDGADVLPCPVLSVPLDWALALEWAE